MANQDRAPEVKRLAALLLDYNASWDGAHPWTPYAEAQWLLAHGVTLAPQSGPENPNGVVAKTVVAAAEDLIRGLPADIVETDPNVRYLDDVLTAYRANEEAGVFAVPSSTAALPCSTTVLIGALRVAEEALVDLHACEDADCHLSHCLRALPIVRAALAQAGTSREAPQ